MDDTAVVLTVTQCGNVEEINRACSKVQWETNVKKLAVHHFSFQMLVLQLSCLCVPETVLLYCCYFGVFPHF